MLGGRAAKRRAGAAALTPEFIATMKRLREEDRKEKRLSMTAAPTPKRPQLTDSPRHPAKARPRPPAPAPPPSAAVCRNLKARRTQSPSPAPCDCRLGDPAHAPAPPEPRARSDEASKAPRAIPTVNFYGVATGGSAQVRAETHRRQLFLSRLHAAVQRYRCIDVFREFYLQRKAVAFADAQATTPTEAACVFAREVDRQGKRKFFVTTYDECWRRLVDTPQGSRHLYEVVREGWPCYLYFDIEYARELNPATDGEAAMAAFLDFLPRGLKRLYPAQNIAVRPEDVIDLDSSTASKFSRHLIVRPRAAQIAFIDNIHMGAFVRHLVDLMHAEAAEGAHGLDSIFVRTSADESWAEQSSECGSDAVPSGAGISAGGKRTGARRAFIDMGVYTKNRCFRTFCSSKFGKPTVLVNARGNQDTYDQHGNEEQLFYNSLVCRLAHPLNVMTLLCDPTLPPSVADHARQNRVHAAMKTGAGASCINHVGGARGATHAGGARGHVVETYGREGQWAEGAFLGPEEREAWKAIGRHVVGVWNKRAGGAQGSIRSASWLGNSCGGAEGSGSGEGGSQPRGLIVTLRIEGNRWCDNIGRQHKSNGIMLIVDRGKGCFWQKCFDPDCRAARARSNEFPLPPSLLHTEPGPDASVRSSAHARPHASASGPSVANSIGGDGMDAGESWGEDMLPSIDAFLQQRGLVLGEDEAEWNDEMLASIDEFLRQRDAQGREGAAAKIAERPPAIGEMSQDEEEQWDEEFFAGIDDIVRQRESMSQDRGNSRAGAAARAEVTMGAGADVVPGLPAGAEETHDASFDDECIRALEQAEQKYLDARRAREEGASD